ncbi:MAG: hypothetical protein IIW69_08115 [Bacteroidaceae bacterium]|nr:hypothetical protein [Bacteroidaceae bacterium]
MNTHDLPLPCHVVCYTVEEALWLREYVEDTYEESEWREAFDGNFAEGFLVQFDKSGDIPFWDAHPAAHSVGKLIFCSELMESEDTESIGEFANVDLENLLRKE